MLSRIHNLLFRNVYAILVAYSIVATALLSIKTFVSLDTVETLYWGAEWQLGYYKHPPFFSWFAASVAQIIGWKSIWVYHFLGVFPKLLSVLYVYYLSLDILHKSKRDNIKILALCASLLVLTSFYFAPLSKYNGNSLMFLFWPGIIYHSYRIIFRPNAWQFLMYGLYCGLAMLSKYYCAIIIATSFCAIIYMKPATLRRPIFYIAILLALAIFAPHIVWLFQHDFISAQYVMNKGESTNRILGLSLVILKNIGLNIIFLLIVAKERFNITRKMTPELKFLMILFFAPLLFNYAYALSGRFMNTFWMSPCFEILPLLYFVGTIPRRKISWGNNTFWAITFSLAIIAITDIAEHIQNDTNTQTTWRNANMLHEKYPDIDCITGMHSKEMGIAYMEFAPKARVYLIERDNCNIIHPNKNISLEEVHTCISVQNGDLIYLGQLSLKDTCKPIHE